MQRAIVAQRAAESAAEQGVEVRLRRESATACYFTDGEVRLFEQSAHLFEFFSSYGGGNTFTAHCAEPQLKKTA